MNDFWSHYAEGVFADAVDLILRSGAEVNLAYLPKPDISNPRADISKPAFAQVMSFARSEWDIGKGSAVTIHLLASSTQLAEGLYCSSYHPPFTKEKRKAKRKTETETKVKRKRKKRKGKWRERKLKEEKGERKKGEWRANMIYSMSGLWLWPIKLGNSIQ